MGSKDKGSRSSFRRTSHQTLLRAELISSVLSIGTRPRMRSTRFGPDDGEPWSGGRYRLTFRRVGSGSKRTPDRITGRSGNPLCDDHDWRYFVATWRVPMPAKVDSAPWLALTPFGVRPSKVPPVSVS